LNRSLLNSWKEAWPGALELWSRYTKLSQPTWLFEATEEAGQGLTGSFAAIRLNDHRILISLRQIEEYGLEDYAPEILAHETGHHVYCPANLLEGGRALAVALKALPTFEKMAPSIINMWEDLLINDRLVREHKQRHPEIYEILNKKSKEKPSLLWSFYMRTYEILWGLRPGRLCAEELTKAQEGDAHLAARMVRVYGNDWLSGVGGYAALCLPYIDNLKSLFEERLHLLFDTEGMGEGCEVPLGILEGSEQEIVHPSVDPNVVGKEHASESPSEENSEVGGTGGQSREPFQYGQILEALGLKLDEHEAAVRFYREQALPHLIPFPTQETEESKEPLMEGLEPWDVGNPLDQVDWMESVIVSPRVIPGVTTVRRTWGQTGGQEKEREPLDLDLYVDCSGSIPNPQKSYSYLTLAGAIVVISALRTGARVQATLWSGPRQFDTTHGFISDERLLLRVLTGYLGGGTAFPNHILRDTYLEGRTKRRPTHILILSDNGIDTMARNDEKGNSGMTIAQQALDKAAGGGTMVLQLYNDSFLQGPFAKQARQMGWEMFRVNDWSGLLDFARKFSKLKYGREKVKR